MIDWFGVFHNALWILGLAVVLAALSYVDWWRRTLEPPLTLRQALGTAGFQAAFSVGMLLFCAGLALGSDRWWEIAAWSLLGLIFGWQAFSAWIAFRRIRPNSEDRVPSARSATTNRQTSAHDEGEPPHEADHSPREAE